MGNPRFAMAALTNTMCEIQFFFTPILAPHLVTTFGWTPIQTGNFFMIFPLVYIISCVSLNYIPASVEMRVCNITGIVGGAVSLLLVGPSPLFFPNSWQLMAFGQGIFGFFNPIGVV